MKTLLLSTSLVLLLVGGAVAEETRHTNVITPEAVKWMQNPAFPKGVQIATLVGDPTKAGETVVQRLKFPPNFMMPPHTHPFTEVVTVISGNIGTNGGEKPEKVRGLLQPGSMWVYPAKHAHYAWTGDGEAVLQVQYTGPGGIEYVNPADDPRKTR
jgi:quercetin dioxygenase-like cupin family protein